MFAISVLRITTVTISIDVSLPNGGFIPKGINLVLTVSFDGVEKTDTASLNLGETETLSLSFDLDNAHTQKLIDGDTLQVIAKALVTPVVFGFEIEQGQQQVDLGSHEISP